MLYMLHACRDSISDKLLEVERKHDVCDVFLVVLSQREACERCARALNAVHAYLSALWLGRTVRVRFASWVRHNEVVRADRLVCKCDKKGVLKHSLEGRCASTHAQGDDPMTLLEWKCQWFIPESQARGRRG